MARITHTQDSLKLAEFSSRYPDSWHTYKKDKRTKKSVDRCLLLGSIVVNNFGQFKFKEV